MLARLEVRVREAEEEVRELPAGEVVGEELHRVGAEGGDVLVGAGAGAGAWRGVGGGGRGVLRAEGRDARVYVVEDLGAEFHAWEGISLVGVVGLDFVGVGERDLA